MPLQACQRLRLAICDDEPMDCALVAQMSREILGAEGVEAELSAYPSAAPTGKQVAGWQRRLSFFSCPGISRRRP